MNSFIKLSPEERKVYCQQAVERMQIPLPAAVIEKDFWVCWTLNLIKLCIPKKSIIFYIKCKKKLINSG
jgi:hypothetical protein